MNFAATARSDRGLKRDGNEDQYLIDDSLQPSMVCDSMHDHANSEVASEAWRAISVDPRELSRSVDPFSRLGNRLPCISISSRNLDDAGRWVRQHWMPFGLLIAFAFCYAAISSASLAQESDTDKDAIVLQVGTKQSPPFAIKNADGSWTGISIDLWNHLAAELDLDFNYQEVTLPEMLSGLEAGKLDAAVAAISVTSERHDRVDFCHPHFSTGLGIAVSSRKRTTTWSLLSQVVSSRLLKIVGSMVLIVAVCGFLFWLFERKSNSSMFGGKKRQGLGMGVWWSMVLLLGHKGIMPVSTMGRLLATMAMFASLIVLSILTGVITSVLTVGQLDTGIKRTTDLHEVRVATVTDSTSADYLRQRRIFFRDYETPVDAIEALDSGKADAVVYDAALLKYLASDQFANRIDVLPVIFNVQEYAIALPQENELRKRLNEALLRFRESDAWDELVYRYLGE